MVNQKITDHQQRLEKILQYLEEGRQLQDDFIKYGLDAVYLYCDEVDGDWLETWGDDNEKIYIELEKTI